MSPAYFNINTNKATRRWTEQKTFHVYIFGFLVVGKINTQRTQVERSKNIRLISYLWPATSIYAVVLAAEWSFSLGCVFDRVECEQCVCCVCVVCVFVYCVGVTARILISWGNWPIFIKNNGDKLFFGLLSQNLQQNFHRLPHSLQRTKVVIGSSADLVWIWL